VIGRREFLLAGGMFVATSILRDGLAHAGDGPGNPPVPGAGFRTITYNVQGCTGWPNRRRNAARLAAALPEMPARVAAELARYKPDVITLVEAPGEDKVAAIAGGLDMRYVYYPHEFGGALLTRGRILESKDRPRKPAAANAASEKDSSWAEDLFTRHFGRAVLDVSIGELVVYSAHLHPDSKSIRAREIAAILEVMAKDLEANRSLLVQGDFNHIPEWPEYRQWAGAGLRDAFATKGAGDPGTWSASKPSVRLDYIWTHGPVAERLVECRVLFEGAFRVDPSDPTAFALSDHLPVMAAFA
jgi:endonuclease/exonuclease/phosphatase family metal-dependent hydrolase